MATDNKVQLVEEFAAKLATAKAAFVADYRGLNVDEVNELRGKLRGAGVEYRVVKNTLLRLAAKGTDFECLGDYLQGPTAIAIAQEDPVAPAKVLAEYAKDSKFFELKTAVLEGKILSEGEVKALAELPSREVLLGKMLGSINAPVSNFVGVLAAVPRSLVQVLGAIRDQKAA
ncbi:50S ribosomal protein L10 [Desulfuromonas acetoxidans]|uniref:Large ribosomal subunit protein uL10 n=1 Tax=Desulfuromonas acetoxidans (strain DSM 684 / 11070) TaxID=281689 RepID=Q1JXF1_DESA6|nr:50S ribosomal protein L10 [Desulfuromonas acetoxidans]EAT14841.1 ribosomal protein L10 [Desulfuromonas acetoxidans DSM 684]MBF0644062.1 50S ribosomal protein L10 [Desulfuromonas acetoxidans]NVD23300.1 50S ribosomal protein L10 [Desulfuromonas acetoxidans]NVE15459.1 50S ribosomal protein L10 [Desulfuromonas acetoxidans]